MKIHRLLLLAIAGATIGCKTGTLPNPNEPTDGMVSPEILYGNYKSISETLGIHVARGDISQSDYQKLLQKAADELLAGYNPDKIDPAKAWQYGDMLINAKKWPEARAAYDVAIENAKTTHNEDRRVNDSLKMAVVLANMGEVDQAIKTARSVFDAKPQDLVPILIGTYTEVVPAARGKGKDLELAKLVEDAIAVDMHTIVDPDLEPGKKYLYARPHHHMLAWKTVEGLYDDAKRPDLAEKARLNEEAMGHDFA